MRTVYGIIAKDKKDGDVFTTDTIYRSEEIAQEVATMLVKDGDYCWTDVVSFNFDGQ